MIVDISKGRRVLLIRRTNLQPGADRPRIVPHRRVLHGPKRPSPVVSLNVKGKTATLGNAQIFDADGKPWPTIFSQSQEEGSTVQIVVAENAATVIARARFQRAGATVEVPIVLNMSPWSKIITRNL